MQYFGVKQRISNMLCNFLNSNLKDGQPFVDLFCGACNIVSKIDSNRLRIANDKHKYLIAMWKSLQQGREMPNSISEEQYKYIRDHKDEDMALTGFVVFGLSYSGKWFGGYCRSKDKRNYCLNAKNSNNKILPYIMDVDFKCCDYKDVDIPIGAMVYCDIPYKGSTQYDRKEVGDFNHDEFYEWVRVNSNKYDIYISEYKKNIPNDFSIVWERNSKKDIRNSKNEREDTVEVLIKYF